MEKVVVRIKGGIGNQLFCYAAARRVALTYNADLVIDDVSGFVRDRQFQRVYMLDRFNIKARKATPKERLEPFERYRRGVAKWLSRRKPYTERSYLEEEKMDFDKRLLELNVKGTLYLDGYWQSEDYFKDVEKTIREDLRIIPPLDDSNQRIAEEIRASQAVSLHIRWFESPESLSNHNLSVDYYQRAVSLMEEKIKAPQYFIFSDDPAAAREKIILPDSRVTVVSQNQGDENAYADLWLMSQCQHFITANSTFSWWGAWLGEKKEKIVITPDYLKSNGVSAWGFKGLIPDAWVKVK